MKTRTQKALLNSFSMFGVYALKTIFQFVSRTIFISTLGTYYLGISGIYTSILGMLSLAELGIASSIIFSLYKPIAEGNQGKIAAYMKLYEKVYRFIAGIILIAGIGLIPFLPRILQVDQLSPDLLLIYTLFLLNSVSGYLLFAYKRGIIEANQEVYIVKWVELGIYIISTICQWAVLYLTRNYILFLLLAIGMSVATNLVIAYLSEKRYPLKNVEIIPLEDWEMNELKKNVVGNFSLNIAAVVISSTDNILISSFINVTTVAILSNYTMITKTFETLLGNMMTSQFSVVGNYLQHATSKSAYDLFKKYHLVNFICSYTIAVAVFFLINPFIQIWLGEQFLLPLGTVAILAIYLFFQLYRFTEFVFVNGYGLYWEVKKRPIVEAVLNIFFSLFFMRVLNLGVSGVLLGTIFATVFTKVWFEPYIVLQKGIKREVGSYFKLNGFEIAIFLVTLGVGLQLVPLFSKGLTIFTWILLAILTVVVGNLILFSVFYPWNKEYRWLLGKLYQLVKDFWVKKGS